MSSIMRARSALTGRSEEWEVIEASSLKPKVAGPSMLGIGCPDRHVLPLTPAENAWTVTHASSRESGFVPGSISAISGVGLKGSGSHDRWSNHDPLDLIEADFIAPAVVELRRARRRMVCHRGGLFQRAAILEIGGNAGGAKAVIAELGFDAGRRGAPADHRIGVCLRQHRAGEPTGAAADCAEQRPLGSWRRPLPSR